MSKQKREAAALGLSEIENAEDLLSLLAVCTFTTNKIAEGDEDAAALAADLSRCLTWSHSLARQIHDDIVMSYRIAAA